MLAIGAASLATALNASHLLSGSCSRLELGNAQAEVENVLIRIV